MYKLYKDNDIISDPANEQASLESQLQQLKDKYVNNNYDILEETNTMVRLVEKDSGEIVVFQILWEEDKQQESKEDNQQENKEEKKEDNKKEENEDIIAKKIIEILNSNEYNISYIPSAYCAMQINAMFNSKQLIPYIEALRKAILHGENHIVFNIPLVSIDIINIIAFCYLLNTLKYQLAFKSTSSELIIQVEWGK